MCLIELVPKPRTPKCLATPWCQASLFAQNHQPSVGPS